MRHCHKVKIRPQAHTHIEGKNMQKNLQNKKKNEKQ